MGKNNYNYRNFDKDMEAPADTPVVEEAAAEVETKPVEETPVVEEKKPEPAPEPKKEEKKVATPKVAAKKVGGPIRN